MVIFPDEQWSSFRSWSIVVTRRNRSGFDLLQPSLYISWLCVCFKRFLWAERTQRMKTWELTCWCFCFVVLCLCGCSEPNGTDFRMLVGSMRRPSCCVHGTRDKWKDSVISIRKDSCNIKNLFQCIQKKCLFYSLL